MILQINGFTEHVGDWKLAGELRANGQDVRERDCQQNFGDAYSATIQDIREADDCVFYSWGGATGWNETNGWHDAGIAKRRLALVACVPCPFYGQFKVWHAPTAFRQAICVQPTKAYPVSEPLIGGPWWDFYDPNLRAVIDERNADGSFKNPIININADALFPDGTDGVDIHTHVQNHPDVLALMVWYFSSPTVTAAPSALAGNAGTDAVPSSIATAPRPTGAVAPAVTGGA